MNEGLLTIPASDIPDSLIKEMSHIIEKYSTVLIRLSINNEGKGNATLIGSGTLVSIGEINGILTAHHIARELSLHDALGLTLIEDVQNIIIPYQHLRIIDIAIPQKDSIGPDLSYIIIPDPYLNNIKAYKSFYPILVDKERILKYPQENRQDLWFVCGTIGERTKEEIPQKGFEQVFGYSGFCGMTFVENSYEIGSFDYIEVKAEFGEEVTPKSFGGFSGGGLWRVSLRMDAQCNLLAKEYILSGVIFYEFILDEEKYLRSHGPNSVYRKKIDKVQS